MATKQRSHGLGSLFKRTERGPWMATWYQHDGRRRERSTRTTDEGAAERILAKHVAGVALRRDGVIDTRQEHFADQGRKLLAEHITAYVSHCRNVGQDTRHVDQKESHLKRLQGATAATRLADLTVDSVTNYLARLRESGLSSRSANFARQIAVAFASWCVKTRRADSNPLAMVPRFDENTDRRRVRRPLSDEGLSKLLDVAKQNGRKARYLAAALAGLRRGDLRRMTWADVNFDDATITVRGGKAKRVDGSQCTLSLPKNCRADLRRHPHCRRPKCFRRQ